MVIDKVNIIEMSFWMKQDGEMMVIEPIRVPNDGNNGRRPARGWMREQKNDF